MHSYLYNYTTIELKIGHIFFQIWNVELDFIMKCHELDYDIFVQGLNFS